MGLVPPRHPAEAGMQKPVMRSSGDLVVPPTTALRRNLLIYNDFCARRELDGPASTVSGEAPSGQDGLDSRGILSGRRLQLKETSTVQGWKESSSSSNGTFPRHRRIAREGRHPRKFLGKDFSVLACYGHVRDLPKKGSRSTGNGYEPTYEVLPGKQKTIAELKRHAKVRRHLPRGRPRPRGRGDLLAPPGAPPAVGARGRASTGPSSTRSRRAPSRRRSRARPRSTSNRVAAQQARRIIDRLVGYEVSDLLWKKVWRGLSAGRVQTVALRIIVERESGAGALPPRAVLLRPAPLAKGRQRPSRRGSSLARREAEVRRHRPAPRDARAAEEVLEHLERSALRVVSVEARERRTNPVPAVHDLEAPAGRGAVARLHRPPDDAGRPAALRGEDDRRRGSVGLITYMRTDSTASPRRRSPRSGDIGATYGADGAPRRAAPLQAEEGRPGRPRGDPADDDGPAARGGRGRRLGRRAEALPADLEPLRRLADDAVRPDVTTVEIEARARARPTGRRPRHRLRPEGRGLAPRLRPGVRDGGRRERRRGTDADAEEGKVRLPRSREGNVLRAREALVEDHETQPPPRFNEASLVKFLEENGIGRPSTYAEILRKIEDREYVRKKDRRFLPTLLGRLVVDLMKEGFDDFFQTEYTARMEEELDEVEEGKLDWRKAVAEFDGNFRKDRDRALKKMVSREGGLAARGREGTFPTSRSRRAPGTSARRAATSCAPDGEERPLRRLRRLPRLRLHRRHPRARGGRGRRVRARRADVRGVRQPDEAPDGARRLVVPRLHGLPELPQHGRREGRRREGRGAARRPDRTRSARPAATTS